MNRNSSSISLLLATCFLSLFASAACAETIYWTDRGSNKIQRASLNGSGYEDLVVVNVFEPVSIALDVVGGKLYWTEASPAGFMISRANLDGTNVELLTPLDHLAEPSGIALDIAAGKLYLTDVGNGRILRANLDGTGQEILVSDPSLDAVEIALDPPGGKMYWTSSTPSGSMISRANLDGTNVETLVTGLLNPSGIALDAVGGKVYWTDIGAGKIQRANMNGTGVEDVITSSVIAPVRISLDLAAAKIYWTEASPADFMISRANLDGSNLEFLFPGLVNPSGIAVLSGPTPVVPTTWSAIKLLYKVTVRYSPSYSAITP